MSERDQGASPGEDAGTPAIPAAGWFEERIGREFEAAPMPVDGPMGAPLLPWRLVEVRRLPDSSVPADGAEWSSFSLLFESWRHHVQGIYRLDPGDVRAIPLFCCPVLTPAGGPGMEAVIHRRG